MEEMKACATHDNFEDLNYHAEQIRESFQKLMQESISQKSETINNVLVRRLRKITGRGIIATVAAAGLLPLAQIIEPIAGTRLPQAFFEGALMEWVGGIGSNMLSDCISEIAKSLGGNGGSANLSSNQEEQILGDISESLLHQFNEDIDSLVAISKIVEKNRLLDIYEKKVRTLKSQTSKNQESQRYKNLTKIIHELSSARMLTVASVTRELDERNKQIETLESEKQKLENEKQELLRKIHQQETSKQIALTKELDEKLSDVKYSIDILKSESKNREFLENELSKTQNELSKIQRENSTLKERNKVLDEQNSSLCLSLALSYNETHSDPSPPILKASPESPAISSKDTLLDSPQHFQLSYPSVSPSTASNHEDVWDYLQTLDQQQLQRVIEVCEEKLNPGSDQPTSQPETDPNQQLWTDPNQQLWTDPNQQLWTDPNQQLWTNPNQQLWTNPNQQLRTDPNQQLRTDSNQQLWINPEEEQNC